MHPRQLGNVAVVFLFCAIVLGSPASAMETTKIEIWIGDVHFKFHGVCVGIDPQTGLVGVVAEMELQPGESAERWIARYTVEGPDEDHAHAWAKLAGVGLFYGQQVDEMLRLLTMDYRLEVKSLYTWEGPVSQSQLLGALQGAINLFFFADTRGLYDAFMEIIGMLQFPAPMCTQGAPAVAGDESASATSSCHATGSDAARRTSPGPACASQVAPVGLLAAVLG